jgi:hypothetical protein
MTNLAAIALALPGVEQGVACAGTALESRTYRVGKKSFLFVSKDQARLKLEASAPEARKLGFVVGANGWVTLPVAALPPAAVVERWIAESHSSMSGGPAGTRAKRPAAKRRR